MKILVFMQNMWVKEPAKVQAILDRHKDNPMFWNKMVAGLLFAGCITGKRIKTTFGDLVKDMIFDESTKEILANPRDIPKADLKHIADTIRRIKPDVLLIFGKHAANAVESMYRSGVIYYHTTPVPKHIFEAPHPAARQPETMSRLRNIAKSIENYKNSLT